mmetsp:Transcript_18597/g.25600  ORF Transcript_18597/g.25600 Transcript_18597/m.25600 type:complete len:300 (-) Transcript_18597:232-1131(-)|eukprot:CAMPEP_0185740242 /NCGR_PEP_ID=MMETSP1171-20130828/37357_1 /TAXON_ID=374046 /ORGANISM="Helicotheca tamensis, Strain CCMP826" /LENGTH=299 /DNA_ID=CAMNT_0028412043 /DNA_START=54 /DNA_END=953 /DNA_ORIENTATION=-
MYGYNDYNGPTRCRRKNDTEEDHNVTGSNNCKASNDANDDDDDDDDDPLRVGRWMEGDSLAPPCGSSLPLVHAMLSFASISQKDVLYDLGCGDGRVCLEAYAKYGCKECVGVEIEGELVDRFHELIAQLQHVVSEDHTMEAGCVDDSVCKLEQQSEEGNIKRYEEQDECSSSVLRQSSIRAIHGDLVEVLQTLLDDIDTESCNVSNVAAAADVVSSSEQLPFGILPIPTVICLYLLPEALELIKPLLVKLMERHKPNLRVVCNTWGLKGLNAVKTHEASTGDGNMTTSTLTMYTHESVT